MHVLNILYSAHVKLFNRTITKFDISDCSIRDDGKQVHTYAMYNHKSNMGYAHPYHWYIVEPSGSFESTHLIHY